RGLARGLRSINLHHPAARQAADAERDIEPQRARRNRLDLDRLAAPAEPHDRALAERALDLGQCGVKRLVLVHSATFDHAQRTLGHAPLLMTGICRPATPLLPPSTSHQRSGGECTLFVLGSQYVLFLRWLLAGFDPSWLI